MKQPNKRKGWEAMMRSRKYSKKLRREWVVKGAEVTNKKKAMKAV